MTANELRKYIQENTFEWGWYKNPDTKDEHVLLLLYIFQLERFTKLLSPSLFDDGGIDIKLLDGYVAIWMNDICSYYGIELEDIFDKELEVKLL